MIYNQYDTVDVDPTRIQWTNSIQWGQKKANTVFEVKPARIEINKCNDWCRTTFKGKTTESIYSESI